MLSKPLGLWYFFYSSPNWNRHDFSEWHYPAHIETYFVCLTDVFKDLPIPCLYIVSLVLILLCVIHLNILLLEEIQFFHFWLVTTSCPITHIIDLCVYNEDFYKIRASNRSRFHVDSQRTVKSSAIYVAFVP